MKLFPFIQYFIVCVSQKFCVIALALIGLVAADVSHLQHPGYSYGASSSSSSFSEGQLALPGGDSSSYQPEHLIPQNLKTVNVETASAQIIPGGDSSSYQPAQVESASAQVIPGGDSSSYQPEQLIPQALKTLNVETAPAADAPESFNLGADTQTPEQFIPEADRIAHYSYIQSQGQAAAPEAQVATVSESVNIGADTQTPEQFIPEADRVAHYSYIHSQGKAVLPTPAAAAQVVPGSDSSSYQPEHLIPQHLKAVHVESGTAAVATESFNLGADTQTPEQFIPEADRIAHATYGQEQAPVVIGANTITPAHLYQEPTSNGIEEFNAETHVPVVIGRDTITPAHLQAKYSAGASTNYGTQYGSNGGYVY
ncbi:uncharacterized protein LOC115765101 [Drosophila novamexicana]|uniref:uncharacterized protein LOC115765101 n=1 Tax=Drosophila novamexicana TaxID=47314 RepID=UPI0011E58B90|nr:uncharacterized protein LOC115765101 [Drosophila novamexicana]